MAQDTRQKQETEILDKKIADYKKDAATGDKTALLKLSFYYEKGIGVEKDIEVSRRYIRLATDLNDAVLNLYFARCYAEGIDGIKKNERKAFHYYQQAFYGYQQLEEDTNEDFIKIQLYLARCYRKGMGTDKNEEMAFRFYYHAASESTVVAENGREKSSFFYQSVTWKTTSPAEANFYLARCYEEGIGTQKDDRQAFKQYVNASQKGHLEASFFVGKCHELGIGTPKDKSKAFEAYLIAAKQGHTKAQVCLGTLYQNSATDTASKEKHLKAAVYWYLAPAQQGNSLAKKNLVKCYEGLNLGEMQVNEKTEKYLVQARTLVADILKSQPPKDEKQTALKQKVAESPMVVGMEGSINSDASPTKSETSPLWQNLSAFLTPPRKDRTLSTLKPLTPSTPPKTPTQHAPVRASRSLSEGSKSISP